jgi:hypothetical protein
MLNATLNYYGREGGHKYIKHSCLKIALSTVNVPISNVTILNIYKLPSLHDEQLKTILTVMLEQRQKVQHVY